MLYTIHINGKQYTVRDTGSQFTIFIDGNRSLHSSDSFDTLKGAVERLEVIKLKVLKRRSAIRILLPIVVLVLGLLVVASL